MSRKVILASQSPSRKRLLESAGISFDVMVSGVDEEDPTIASLKPSEMVIALSILKAHTVRNTFDIGDNALIIGCDSTFEFEGESLGKPMTHENAVARAKRMRGKTGLLHTGHCIIDTHAGVEVTDISTSRVFMAEMSDEEIEAYVSTGEPLELAGGFSLDGISAPFVSRIEGDPSGIIGLSLPTLRTMVRSIGLNWFDLVTVKAGVN